MYDHTDQEDRDLIELRRATLRADVPHHAPGKLAQRYRNYLAHTDERYPLSFDEWLNT